MTKKSGGFKEMRFKRALLLSLLLILLIPAGIAPASVQAAAAKAIQIVLDGDVVSSDVPPYLREDLNVTMVPLRVISESLGAQVRWSQAAKQVTISQDDTIITMVSGQNSAFVNGSVITLDATVQTVSGRVMVPLRFVSNQLGVAVRWDNEAKVVNLYKDTVSPVPSTPASPAATPAPTPAATTKPSPTATPVPTAIPTPTPAATTEPLPTVVVPTPAAGTELRGVWVSTIYNLDFPSTASYGKQAMQEKEFKALLDDVQAMGMNAVFVQVRPSADALYPSDLVPWSKVLTGKQGVAPTYDPLQFMLDETHRRGMTFHAWFNPFRANTDTDTSKLASNHVAVEHPDWVLTSGSQLLINPGVPAARQHVIDVIMEVVNHYDIDGVHLDDYFYPSNITLSDDDTFKTYNSKKLATKAEWRRSNIDEFVRQLDESIHSVRPTVDFGISPFGVWRNKSQDANGSDTNAGVTAYDSMSADVRKWVKQGWIDYVAPQVYWSMSLSAARYDKVVDWWAAQVANTDVDLYIGHAAYKLGTKETGWQTSEEIIKQLKYNTKHPEVKGDIYFSAKDLRKNPLGIIDALKSYYGK